MESGRNACEEDPSNEVKVIFVREHIIWHNTGVEGCGDVLFSQPSLVTQHTVGSDKKDKAECGKMTITVGQISTRTRHERHPRVLPGTVEINNSFLLQSGNELT